MDPLSAKRLGEARLEELRREARLAREARGRPKPARAGARRATLASALALLLARQPRP